MPKRWYIELGPIACYRLEYETYEINNIVSQNPHCKIEELIEAIEQSSAWYKGIKDGKIPPIKRKVLKNSSMQEGDR